MYFLAVGKLWAAPSNICYKHTCSTFVLGSVCVCVCAPLVEENAVRTLAWTRGSTHCMFFAIISLFSISSRPVGKRVEPAVIRSVRFAASFTCSKVISHLLSSTASVPAQADPTNREIAKELQVCLDRSAASGGDVIEYRSHGYNERCHSSDPLINGPFRCLELLGPNTRSYNR